MQILCDLHVQFINYSFRGMLELCLENEYFYFLIYDLFCNDYNIRSTNFKLF